MKNTRIVPVMAKCAVLCAVLIVVSAILSMIVACEPYNCVDGTLVSAPAGVSTGVSCGNASPYTCANGTVKFGVTHEQDTERCTSCNAGFDLDVSSRRCVADFICPNGTVVSGVTIHKDVERCSVCDVGYTLNASNQCLPNFAPVYSVTHSATLNLRGPRNIVTAAVGDATYLFVALFEGSGVSVFSAGADGALTFVQNVSDDAALKLRAAFDVATAVVGDTTYLFVAGFADLGVSVFSVGADGKLASVDNVGGLPNAISVATAAVGDATYLFVAEHSASQVTVFSVGADGTLTRLTSVRDFFEDSDLRFTGPYSLTTAVVGSATYLFVAGYADNGVGVLSVGTDGALTSVDNVSDDADLQLGNASSVATATVGSATYLFVTGSGDDGVSVFSVGADGKLASVDNVTDNTTLALNGATSADAATVGDITYLFVAGYADDGVSVFSVGTDGALTSVANILDNSELELDGAISTATAAIGNATYLFVSGRFDYGVSVFRLP